MNREQPRTIRITAAALADASAERTTGELRLRLDHRGATILPVNAPDDQPGDTVDLPDHTLVPAFVNAHTHLDLTAIGPHPFDHDAGFNSFLNLVIDNRPTTPDAIADSVRTGAALSLAGGVIAVGDIAGALGPQPTLAPWRALRETDLLGVSYMEFFSFGAGEPAATERVPPLIDTAIAESVPTNSSPDRVRFGLTPHAPYTVNRASYRRTLDWARAANPSLPLTTHLAETLDERRFITRGEGPQLDLLRRMGIFEDRERTDLAQTDHPVAHMAEILTGAPWLVAHMNDLEGEAGDRAIDTLARTNTSVAYCPRAHAYFRIAETVGPHRYRDLLAAGVNLCLGTDSIINLDTPDRITPFDDARLLVRRDGLDPRLALKLITTNPARALGLDPAGFDFTPGPLAGLVALPGRSLAEAMAGDAPPKLLLIRNRFDLSGIRCLA